MTRALPFLLPLLHACTLTATAVGAGPGSGGDDYYTPSETYPPDHVYRPTVRTVQLFKAGFELAPGIIELGGNDGVMLRFDDVAPDPMILSYTLVHCDAQWRPTDLPKGMYLEGAFMDIVPPGRQSFNTLQPFIQYEVEIPNRFMRPTRSGNYLLKVFHDNDEEDLVLTRRLLVFEQRVEIDARMQASRNVELRNTHQQLDITVRHPAIDIPDPFGDLHLVVLQNMRWDDARTGLRPRFVRGRELVYDHLPEALFVGGNEWRNFDLKDLRFRTPRVADVRYGKDLMEAILVREPKRSYKVHLEEPDINGRYLIRNDDVDGDPLGADYVNVLFQLAMDEPLHGGDVYVVGGFSDLGCRDSHRMTWNEQRAQYELFVPIKQGFHDFQYAFMPKRQGGCDLSFLEGTHFQTENDYAVLVYFSDPMLRLDRLVGVRFLNTRRG